MGSGGGGGGGTPSGKKPPLGGSGGPDFEPTNCDITFETDLSAVDGEVAATLASNDVLVIGTARRGGFEAIVCRTSDGLYVGTVSHIENLAQLLACIRSGVVYQAVVMAAGATFCTVFVGNA